MMFLVIALQLNGERKGWRVWVKTYLSHTLQIQLIRLPIPRPLRHRRTTDGHVNHAMFLPCGIEKTQERLIFSNIDFQIRHAPFLSSGGEVFGELATFSLVPVAEEDVGAGVIQLGYRRGADALGAACRSERFSLSRSGGFKGPMC